MSFIAKDSGGDFKKIPPGSYIARCFGLIDMGTQLNETFGKAAHKLQIRWEVFGEDEAGQPLEVEWEGRRMPMTISKTYTLSLHAKAGLRKDLAAWRGRDFSEEEAKGFDVSKLLNAYCMINVTHSESNGKVYANVAGLAPIPKALAASKPAPVHPLLVFDISAPDMAVFASLHEKMQEVIKRSPEWADVTGTKAEPAGALADGDDDLDDVPFASSSFALDMVSPLARRMRRYA